MKKQLGFTLIELLTTLVIASILATLAVPAWKTFREEIQSKTLAQQLLHSLAFARQQTIVQRKTLVICPVNLKDSNQTCGTLWQNGWVIAIDQPREILRVINAPPKAMQLQWHDLQQDHQLVLRPDSTAEGSNGSFYFLHYRLVINRGGRAHLESYQ